MSSTITRRALGASTLALAATFTALMSLTGCASLSADRPAATVAQFTAQKAELSTFNKLIQQSGLSSTLEGAAPLTVFAPTDDAFKAVPQATMDKLAKDPDALKALLSYHVVPGVVKSTDVNGASTLTTLGGAKLAVSKAGDFVTVDDSLVTQADQSAGNGVVHIIDRVLTPPKK